VRLLGPIFGWLELEERFSDRARVQALLDFEAALARAEARAGVIPAAAATAIAAHCVVERFDLEALAREAAGAGNVAIPLVRQLAALVEGTDAGAARFVHWGATSQDAVDTGLVLQIRGALELIREEVDRLADALADLASLHRATPIAGRTWMQQATPMTFGFKAAGWLDAVLRHRGRVIALGEGSLALQLGGAVGTLGALGDEADLVGKALAEELGLPRPDVSWHAHRDRLGEVATTLGLLAGTLGKIARDVALHAQTEVAELSEPGGEGRGGSSTMPHKRNAVASAVALAASARVPGLVATMLSAMVQEDERGLGGWQAEWETLPEIVTVTGGALHHLTDAIVGLQVDRARMSANLDATQGLVFAEAVRMALAEKAGRATAQNLVERACRRAHEERRHLREVLSGDPEVGRHLPASALDRLFDARPYLEAAAAPIDRVIEAHAAARRRSGR
jgi:3-carboxy-cis,cis-muconate cycloisomerase